jgi:tetratricopeptide (TPR) repeat protein
MPRFEQRSRHRFFPALLFAMLVPATVGVSPAAARADESPSARVLAEGREAMWRGKSEQALERAREALDAAETNAEKAAAWELAGLVRLRASTQLEAEHQMVQSQRHQRGRSEPTEKEAALATAWRQEMDRAEEAFRQALLLEDLDSTHRYLAEIHFRRGDLEAARRELSKVGDDAGDAEIAACLAALEGHDTLDRLDEAPADPEAPSITAPKKLEADAPRFPSGLRSAFSVVRAVIDEKGEVICVQRVADDLDEVGEAVAAAVQDWRFEPAVRSGEPIPVLYYVTIKFLRN